MTITLTCHPARHGAARCYTVKRVEGRQIQCVDILARNGREAIAAFRRLYDTASAENKEAA